MILDCPSNKCFSGSGGVCRVGSCTLPFLQHNPEDSPLNFVALQCEQTTVMELISRHGWFL